MNHLKSHLFETNAVKVCHGNKPFWLTSGKISAYFINTHFVYGNEEEASSLLSFIDDNMKDTAHFPTQLLNKVKTQYENNSIYHHVIDEMVAFIKNTISLDEIDYISGGERRDWFFSNIIASSFIRAWIPAIQNLGGELIWSLSVVDRMQGGKERLEDLGIQSYSLVSIDETLFEEAFTKGIIDESQFALVSKFVKDPDGSMEKFVKEHPDFIENALHSDAKTAGRAQLCIDNHFYGL